jgi:hypothetical protein
VGAVVASVGGCGITGASAGGNVVVVVVVVVVVGVVDVVVDAGTSSIGTITGGSPGTRSRIAANVANAKIAATANTARDDKNRMFR